MTASADFLRVLNFQHPIIQAPLAGGGDTPELVAAVSNAGGLGFVGAAYLSPVQIAEVAHAVKSKTTRPFGINLFAPSAPATSSISPDIALQRVAPYFAELGLPAPSLPSGPAFTFSDQLAAAMETGVSAFSFTFGLLPAESMQSLKQKRIFVMGTATTVNEAIELEKSGVDAIVAQGSEAGGHRGTFQGDPNASLIGTISLVPQVVDAVQIPVVASGGIMDGRGIAAALALGASAVQLGTAFLTCHESGIPDAYRAAIFNAREDQTRVTRAFSGRAARGIVNRFMTEVEPGGDQGAILPFPLQNALTRPLRTAAAKNGRAEFLSLWAGQGIRMAHRQSAAELVARLVAETDEAIRQLGGFRSHESSASRSGAASN
jgi:nitronate monooxygenase